MIRDPETLEELGNITTALCAPDGLHDDRATAHVLALAALRFCSVGPLVSVPAIPPVDIIAEADRGGWSLGPMGGEGMAGATNLSDLELDGRGIQAREIDSGAAADGDVLTANGLGGAAWAQPAAGGGGACVGAVWLGSLGTDSSAVMNGHISAAYRDRDGCRHRSTVRWLLSLICGTQCLRWRCIGRIKASGGVSWTVLSSVEGRMTVQPVQAGAVFAG